MFDVSWTDPGAETVGERRRRKERTADKTSQGSRRSSLTSTSTGSGASSKTQSASRSGWGIFGGGSSSSKKSSTKDKDSSISQSKPRSSKAPKEPLVLSAYSEPHRKGPQQTITRIHEHPDELHDYDAPESVAGTVRTYPSTYADSTFSAPAFRSSVADSWGSVSEESTKNYDNLFSTPHPGTLYEDDPDLHSLMDEVTLSPKRDTSDSSFRNRYTTDRRKSPLLPGHQYGQSQLPPRAPSPTNRPLPQPPQPENAAMQQRIRRMEAASPKIVLERLKEEWDDITDDAIYNELELEKHLWMLVGLRVLQRNATAGDANKSVKSQERPGSQAGKALSLYESTACANYLSTTKSQTHHLSLNPITLEQSSHLRVLIVTTPVSNLPYAPSTFTTINSMKLPTLLPSSSLPTLLQECHRVLGTNGTLNLLIMDPSPRSSTMGPKMKAWLEDHLILKLETQFRCLKPTKLMPIWLREAGFRIAPTVAPAVPLSAGVEPKNTNLKFRAIARGEGGFGAEGAGPKDRKKNEMEILASTVGRMLWREIWGQYVVGDSWWWQDEAIIEEAYSLGTKWDFTMVEAIKQG
ncbi:hypothetical protein PVAG01_10285 [Phlyctema vagabunda]|uniref:Uncharacterized protein n=1 Tax=Phlyctema vagabunda TaxID=108571 RepID=A0ABR4P5I4_9HELO